MSKPPRTNPQRSAYWIPLLGACLFALCTSLVLYMDSTKHQKNMDMAVFILGTLIVVCFVAIALLYDTGFCSQCGAWFSWNDPTVKNTQTEVCERKWQCNQSYAVEYVRYKHKKVHACTQCGAHTESSHWVQEDTWKQHGELVAVKTCPICNGWKTVGFSDKCLYCEQRGWVVMTQQQKVLH